MVALVSNPSVWEAETGRLPKRLRSALDIKLAPGHPGIQNKALSELSQKGKEKRKENPWVVHIR